MKKAIIVALLMVFVIGLAPRTNILAEPKTSGDFKIVTPEFNFSDKQKWMVIEYWLDGYQKVNDDVLYLDVLRLNTSVWPLPSWVDKTYYISQERYDQLFDREFNTMFAESEAQKYSLDLPVKSGEKHSIRIDVDPYYDYLVSMTFVRDTESNFETGSKLIGGNYLELTPRADIRSEMEKITKNSATIICMPQMFYASKKDMANIKLDILDMQADKLTAPIVFTKQTTVRAIKDPNQAPPWCQPGDSLALEATGLLPDHTYLAKITSKFPNRLAITQKIFTTSK